MMRRPPRSTLFPDPPPFRSDPRREIGVTLDAEVINHPPVAADVDPNVGIAGGQARISGQTEQEAKTLAPLISDRKSTRLNSSHANISYAVFCLKKKQTDRY